ncbi:MULTISPECIES: glutamate--tRNA ligase [unclassified Rathayibacter]|uniref:glutamate--tRNA ligase n=1 Tax=unclassified Rathayibacter TaxID=2609250 RepID=UPI000CE8C9BF|nr:MULTISPECIES: glutamate--tRNA ligase [unclassified Rathayibacter]PPF58092.1 glutamate--tRNA ligase [Rathayibacter sp. AY1C2]PPG05335.1 glutamate--tRNA ligase [Rathayibacter sp. AY2B1]PPG17768.1 glutamate--tRNA ligase [Rathayibacter sp. AY1C6]PPG56748.1 glutamate--tRNA ligase [Rathayibacter sp. AY2B7]PPG73489.1 glutamate--tRNA ligase [Rathayibacter sp. AY1F4]
MSELTPPLESAPDAHPFTTATGSDVRVRFCPSPTGTPHVGLIRTALFNWAYARHTGGTFVFRIEDTDAARDSEESVEQILDALRWLKLDWDEGVGVGGPHGPYRQSERTDVYLDVIARLTASGHLYESYSTAEEIDARNEAAGRAKQHGYDNHDRDLTEEERAAFRAEGRAPALRLRVPDADLSFDDLVRGPITFPAGSFSDFVVVRPNGQPLYTLVNPVDDAIMQITHVLRGEDILPSTARQIALYHALIDIGVTTFVPRFGHLPYVMGDGSKKLSKRDPSSNLFHHRDRGFIPEGLVNYLALLGWSLTHDRDVFSIDEMVAAFDVADVNPNPARFDLKKAESINGDHIRLLAVDDFTERTIPYLVAAGVLAGEPTAEQRAVLDAAAPLVQERIGLLGEAPGMLGFLFTASDALEYDEDALKGLPANAGEVLAASIGALELVPASEWLTASIQEALASALIEGLGLKPRIAYGPLRTAVSGRRVSPPLFESMEILGKQESIARLDRLGAHLGTSRQA